MEQEIIAARQAAERGEPPAPRLLYTKTELREMRKRMQLVYQDPYSSVDPRFRVRDIVAEPWVIHGLYDSFALAGNAASAMIFEVEPAPGSSSPVTRARISPPSAWEPITSSYRRLTSLV